MTPMASDWTKSHILDACCHLQVIVCYMLMFVELPSQSMLSALLFQMFGTVFHPSAITNQFLLWLSSSDHLKLTWSITLSAADYITCPPHAQFYRLLLTSKRVTSRVIIMIANDNASYYKLVILIYIAGFKWQDKDVLYNVIFVTGMVLVAFSIAWTCINFSFCHSVRSQFPKSTCKKICIW